MAELHSITGMFFESFPGISPWGGYFIRGADKQDESIEGMLADIYGMSKITGTMNDDLMIFTKQYKNEGHAFRYSFSLREGLWKGEYAHTSLDISGRSICKTNLCIKDLSFRKFDTRTTEGYVNAMIESMVENGLLEKFEDPQTGKEMIKPTVS